MNDREIETMLDDHVWPAMPERTRAALRSTIGARAQRRARWATPALVAAALLLGVAIGWALPARSAQKTPEPTTAQAPPARVVIETPVFTRAASFHSAGAGGWTTISSAP